MAKKIEFDGNNRYIPFNDENKENSSFDVFGNFCQRITSQDRFSGWGRIDLNSDDIPDKILFPIRLISKLAQNFINCQKESKDKPDRYSTLKDFLRAEVCPRIKAYVKLNEDRVPVLVELCHTGHAGSCENPGNNPNNKIHRQMFKGMTATPDGNICLLTNNPTPRELKLYNPPISDEIITGLSKRFLHKTVIVPKWFPISAKTLSDITLDHFIPIHFMLIRKYAIAICGGGNINDWHDSKLIDREEPFTLVDLSDCLFHCAKEWYANNPTAKENPFKPKKFSPFIEELSEEQRELLRRICNDVASSFTDENLRKAYFAFQLMQGKLNYVKGNG